MKAHSLYIIFILFITKTLAQSIDGITMVATPGPIGIEAFERVKKTNAEWVCFVPYSFQKMNDTKISFNLKKQWWGETTEGIESCIKMAHQKNLNVFLKPQIYIHNGWTGKIDYKTEKEWLDWEESYKAYINAMLEFAINHKVEMFCIGTELETSAIKREKFWRQLIQETRKRYKGQIVYSSNWDSYKNIPFWDELDYIGLNTYFPITDMKTPALNVLEIKWKKIAKELETFSNKWKKKILLTEYGYLTTDYCAWRTWENEKKIHELNENQDAQATAYEGLYRALWNKSFIAGGFIWKWFPMGLGHEGYKSKDYDPQDKKAESVISKYYQN